MADYQKLYTLLFNACTDAIVQIDRQNYGIARDLLVCAQQDAEELYMLEDQERKRRYLCL